MSRANTSVHLRVGSLVLLLAGGCSSRIDESPPWDAGGNPAESTGETEVTSTASDTQPSSSGVPSEPTSTGDATDTHDVERSWGPEIILENTDADAKNVQVTMDAAGNTLFAWRELDSQARSEGVMTRYFSVATGWGPLHRLANYAGGRTRDVRLCGNQDGSAVLSWTNSATTVSGAPAALSVAYFSPSRGLQGPFEFEPSGAVIGCGMDEWGRGMLVWSSAGKVLFSRGEGTDWTPPEVVLETTGFSRLVVNSRGNAVLVGAQGSGDAAVFSVLWYDAERGWGARSSLSVADFPNIDAYAVALGGDDTAHLAWVARFSEYAAQVWTSSLAADGGWSEPLRLDDDDEWSGSVTLSADEAGDVLAVWTSRTPFLENRVRARRLTAGAGWEVRDNFIGEHGTLLSSTLGPKGHGLAAFRDNDFMDDEGSIEIVYLPPERPWSTFVSQVPAVDSLDPAVAVNGAGQAVVAWEHVGYGHSQARALFLD